MIRLGGGQDFRIGDGIHRRAGHDFRHMHQALMGNAGFALRGQLPGMPRRTNSTSGPARLHRWHRPGNITNIGGPHTAKALVFEGHDLVTKRQIHLRRQAVAAEGGDDILRLQRRLNFARIAAIILIKLRRTQALEIVIHRLFQRRIAKQIGHRADHLGGPTCLRHQRGAVGNLAHACNQAI